MNGGNAVAVFYLDEAFNKAPHNILISKLLKYEVDDTTIRWIYSCLVA